MKYSVKKGDNVVVIAGDDKGKIGAIKNVCFDGYVTVEGVNLVKRAVKNNPEGKNFLTFEKSIHVSKVRNINKKTKKNKK